MKAMKVLARMLTERFGRRIPGLPRSASDDEAKAAGDRIMAAHSYSAHQREVIVLTVVCAWCQTVMRQGTSARVSHGLCARCADTMLDDSMVVCPACGGSGNAACADDVWVECARCEGGGAIDAQGKS